MVPSVLCSDHSLPETDADGRGPVQQPAQQLGPGEHAGGRVTARWSRANPASASSPCAGRIAASAAASRSASSSESPGGQQRAAARAGQHLGRGRRLGQRARHRVDLAALQRHRPAAGARTSAASSSTQPAGSARAVDHRVGEQLARRCAGLQHERAAARAQVRPRPRPAGRSRPAARRTAAVQSGSGTPSTSSCAAVGGDRVPGRRPGQPHPGQLLGGPGGGGHDGGHVAAARAGLPAAASVRNDSGAPR